MKKNTLTLIFFLVISQLAGLIGSIFTSPQIPTWYASLSKSPLNPPSWVFAPVWTILFAFMGIAAFLVWKKGWKHKEVKIALAVFGVQLALNTLWSILFFGLQSPQLAFMEIFVLWFAILATLILFYRITRPAGYLFIPYILWVSFAIYLNYAITVSATTEPCNFNKDYAYKAPNSSAVYFITDQCTKRLFTKANIFFTYFPSWDWVSVTPARALQALPNDPLGFMPYGPLYNPQYGALVKTVSDPKVYLLLGGKKYWITSETVFNALQYQWNWIEDVDPRLLDKYSFGSEITKTNEHPPFTLIKYPQKSEVYRLESGTDNALAKRHIVDEAVFRVLGFRLDRIVTIPATEAYSDGSPLTAPDVPPPAPPVQNNQTQVTCVSNPNPVFTHSIVNINEIINIIPPPNIHRGTGDLKTHSFVDMTRVGLPVYAPTDMELIDGAHYVSGPYFLEFRVSCEVRLRFSHIMPIEKIKELFPKEPQNGSKSKGVPQILTFKAGEIVAYIYKDQGVMSTGVDFGVYNSTKKNKYDGKYESSIYTTADCPYDYFFQELATQYRSKFDLQIPEGLQKDGASFCQKN